MHVNVKKGVNKMPNVGGEEFAYTPEGIAAAKEKAEQTGEELKVSPSPMQYNAGGRVKKLKGYYGGGMVADYMGGYSEGGKVKEKK